MSLKKKISSLTEFVASLEHVSPTGLVAYSDIEQKKRLYTIDAICLNSVTISGRTLSIENFRERYTVVYRRGSRLFKCKLLMCLSDSIWIDSLYRYRTVKTANISTRLFFEFRDFPYSSTIFESNVPQ